MPTLERLLVATTVEDLPPRGKLTGTPLMPHERVVPAYLVGETSHVVVFACGDPLRGDDSVAPRACKALPPENPGPRRRQAHRCPGD